ncbi:MAG: N-formylglutamate amidohydrolase, partial [Bdellovibrionales bacterium]|nr:N-formylglutamate amidohydrolase [Bdellovibrionales bacterium]
MLNRQVLLLCEHASNTLPIWANGYFPPDARKLLNSHRAWDKGVASLGKGLAQEIHCPLILGKHSRLLLDLNRSLDSKALWSEWSREMSEKLKQKAIREFYLSYRKEARECLRHHLSKGPTLVLALHSFTPTWKGKDRPTDLGILFRPETSRERQMADWMRLQLGLRLPNWKIHFNL